MVERFETHGPEGTAEIAAALAARIRGGETVALVGNLGAGKTTFTQAFARALGATGRLQSPTFIFLQEHLLAPEGTGPTLLAHADAYRGGPAELRSVGLEEYMGRPDAVLLVEWADRVEELLPERRITVRLEHLGGDRRAITIDG